MTCQTDKKEAYAVSMQSDLQLIREFWARDLPYDQYAAFVAKHGRPVATKEEFDSQCAALTEQMYAEFGQQ